jgi:hypothetical protein
MEPVTPMKALLAASSVKCNTDKQQHDGDRGASYRDCEFFVAFSCCLLGIRAVHLQGFRKRGS